MRILLTGCQMQAAVGEIRKLGRHGHFIVAADTFEGARGNHSKYVHRTVTVASPLRRPEVFVDDIAHIITAQKIDIVVPCFEQALFLAHALDRLPATAEYLFPSFDAIYAFHHEMRGVETADELGVQAPSCLCEPTRGDDDPEALEIARRFVSWSGYEGKRGLGFRRTPEGLAVIECSTRPTAGVHLFGEDTFVDALLPESAVEAVTAHVGLREKVSFASLRKMVLHAGEALCDLRHSFSRSAKAIAMADDPWPAAYHIASLSVVRADEQRRAERHARATDSMAAHFDHITWSGESPSACA